MQAAIEVTCTGQPSLHPPPPLPLFSSSKCHTLYPVSPPLLPPPTLSPFMVHSQVVNSVFPIQVAIEVPSIKATLSDREFQLITSIAGDNFNEAQQVPASALWLERHHLRMDEDEEENIGYVPSIRLDVHTIPCFQTI